jgi:3-hydroxyacyl-[acyl-carrier-protein] dehydratase
MSPSQGPFPTVSSVLPHRAPFLFIERVVELSDDRVVAVRTFRADEPFFAGHFPGNPMVPGVVLIEGLAQAMAYHSLFHQPGRKVFLVGIDRARFRSPVGFGVEIAFSLRVGGERFGMVTGQGVVSTGPRHLAEATLIGYAADPDKPPPVTEGSSAP